MKTCRENFHLFSSSWPCSRFSILYHPPLPPLHYLIHWPIYDPLPSPHPRHVKSRTIHGSHSHPIRWDRAHRASHPHWMRGSIAIAAGSTTIPHIRSKAHRRCHRPVATVPLPVAISRGLSHHAAAASLWHWLVGAPGPTTKAACRHDWPRDEARPNCWVATLINPILLLLLRLCRQSTLLPNHPCLYQKVLQCHLPEGRLACSGIWVTAHLSSTRTRTHMSLLIILETQMSYSFLHFRRL